MESRVFQRLIDERQRLGLNKTEMAELFGVAQPTYLRYEDGKRTPDADALAKAALNGADVLYILTGQRSQPVAPQELLPPDERILLDNYRHAPAAVQAGIKTTLGAFAPAASGASPAHKRRA